MASRKKKNANNLEIVSLNEHKNRRMNVTSLDEHKRRRNEAAELLEQKREQRRRQEEYLKKQKEEEKRINAEREEAQRKNRITVQSVYGTPTRGGTLKNELTEKAGPYKSAAGSLSGYMKDLKDRSSTLSGTKLHGPVVSADKALENYRKQEQKKQEEAQRKNKILLQSAYGTPTRGGTLKNELTEKTGPYRTPQNALNNYFKDLKKRGSTLSGTTLDGPVVKPEQALENYKKIIQKKQEEAQRKNRIMVQSAYGTPTRGGTLKNELTEKAGPYRTN
ncbi:MAG: hypothetical protein J6Y48_00375, partial [Clostridia bacterium]|nr:hypothetical protein [Clostridia bacterium]